MLVHGARRHVENDGNLYFDSKTLRQSRFASMQGICTRNIIKQRMFVIKQRWTWL